MLRRALGWLRTPWGAALSVTVAVVVAQRLAGLGYSPPGLYNDEASIGYNAWAIAHYGVDEHGARMPLYFQAFGEYKNPLYIYMLAPLTWFLPFTAATVRLPAALCGVGICLGVAGTAWAVTRDRLVTWLALVTAWLTPWAALQSRVAFEVVTMVLCLTLALWCFARGAAEGARSGWRWAAGTFLALSVFAYSTGRAFALLLVVAMILSRDRSFLPSRRALPVLVPVGVAYIVLGLYGLHNPDALSSRFDHIGITADAPGAVVLAARFVRNYATYFGVPFLLTNGDAYLRHNTGYGGQLLVATLPILLAGVWGCLRRRGEPVPRLLLVGLAVAPVPAALTFDDTPHALRAATMLPFLLGLMVYGWAEVLPLLRSRRALAMLAGMAVAIDGAGFLWDLYARYPDRTVTGAVVSGLAGTYPTGNWFDAGQQEAIQRGHALAAGHHLWLSRSLDQPGIQALFALTPAPVRDPGPDDTDELAAAGVTVLDDAVAIGANAQVGDVMVLAPGETPPARAVLAFTVDWTTSPQSALPGGYGYRSVTLASVYQVRAPA